MVFGILIIGVLVYSMKEPTAISEEELYDEVSQSQQRAIWLACLSIASRIIDHERPDIIKISQQLSQPYNLLVSKIAAEAIENCVDLLEFDSASALLLSNEEDLWEKTKEIYVIQLHKFENHTLELSQRQKEIVKVIKKEMNTVDDGFDQEPPIVKEALLVKNLSLKEIIAGAVVGLTCFWLVFKIFMADDKGVKNEKFRKTKKIE